MTYWTLTPQRGPQLDESLRRTPLFMDPRARAQLPGYEQGCLCLSVLISTTSLLVPCQKKKKKEDVEEMKWIQVLSKKAEWMIYREVIKCLWTQDVNA